MDVQPQPTVVQSPNRPTRSWQSRAWNYLTAAGIIIGMVVAFHPYLMNLFSQGKQLQLHQEWEKAREQYKKQAAVYRPAGTAPHPVSIYRQQPVVDDWEEDSTDDAAVAAPDNPNSGGDVRAATSGIAPDRPTPTPSMTRSLNTPHSAHPGTSPAKLHRPERSQSAGSAASGSQLAEVAGDNSPLPTSAEIGDAADGSTAGANLSGEPVKSKASPAGDSTKVGNTDSPQASEPHKDAASNPVGTVYTNTAKSLAATGVSVKPKPVGTKTGSATKKSATAKAGIKSRRPGSFKIAMSHGPKRHALTPAPEMIDEGLIRLRIPRIGIDTIVVPNVTRSALTEGPGHFPETALPWEIGNCVIAGHRNIWGNWFMNLYQLQRGDVVILETMQHIYTYRVTGQETISPRNVSVLRDHGRRELTLVTCNVGAQRRVVVHALLKKITVP